MKKTVNKTKSRKKLGKLKDLREDGFLSCDSDNDMLIAIL